MPLGFSPLLKNRYEKVIRFFIFIVGIALSIHLAGADWSSYGADPGRSQYSSLDQIAVDNVQDPEARVGTNPGDPIIAFSLPALLQASD